MVSTEFDVTWSASGPLFAGGKVNIPYSEAAMKATARIAQVVADAARADYAKKRKTQTSPLSASLIFASILYPTSVSMKSATEFSAIVFAGNGVPYAVYVHEGHMNRGGKGRTEGYKFMVTGMEAGAAAAQQITEEEFSKIGG